MNEEDFFTIVNILFQSSDPHSSWFKTQGHLKQQQDEDEEEEEEEEDCCVVLRCLLLVDTHSYTHATLKKIKI